MIQKIEREKLEKLCEIIFRKWTILNFLQDKILKKKTELAKFGKIYLIKVFCETKF